MSSLVLQERWVLVTNGVLEGVVIGCQELALAIVLGHDIPKLRSLFGASLPFGRVLLQVHLFADPNLRSTDLVLLTAVQNLDSRRLLLLLLHHSVALAGLSQVIHPLTP